MVNLEAAINKTPVITTHQTGLKPEWNENGGKLINPNLDELTHALENAIKWDQFERETNGRKLSDFVIEFYSWEKRFVDWENTYEKLKS